MNLTKDLLIPLVPTIVGVVLGFFLSEWKAWASKRHVSKSIKPLLIEEIHKNKQLLSSYWDERFKNEEYGQKQKEAETKIQKFLSTTMPYLSSEIYQSYTTIVTTAFKKEELQKVLEFYNNVQALKDLRVQLLNAEDRQTQSIAGSGTKDLGDGEVVVFPKYNLKRISIEAWQSLKTLTEALLSSSM